MPSLSSHSAAGQLQSVRSQKLRSSRAKQPPLCVCPAHDQADRNSEHVHPEVDDGNVCMQRVIDRVSAHHMHGHSCLWASNGCFCPHTTALCDLCGAVSGCYMCSQSRSALSRGFMQVPLPQPTAINILVSHEYHHANDTFQISPQVADFGKLFRLKLSYCVRADAIFKHSLLSGYT